MRASRLYVSIFESELRTVALEASSRTDETGGDLFGLWSAGRRPVIFLAVGPGPDAVHERAHFGQDVAFLSSVAQVLQDECGLQYLGDWHSHHELGLRSPSSGDAEHIRRIARRNGFDSMAELILTHLPEPLGSCERDDRHGPCAAETRSHDGCVRVEIGGFMYAPALAGRPVRCDVTLLPGESPFRKHLIEHPVLGAAIMRPWQSFPRSRLSLSSESATASEPAGSFRERASFQKALAKAIGALERTHESPVEVYEKEFGYVIVVLVGPGVRLGIAIGPTLPFRLLGLYRMGEGSHDITDLSAQIPISDAPAGPRLFQWAHEQSQRVCDRQGEAGA